MLGRIEEVEARDAILFPAVQLVDTGATSVRETADQVAVLGRSVGGCVIAVDVNGGIAPEAARFSLAVRGTRGSLGLTGGHPYGFQAGDRTLTASAPFDAPASRGGLMGAATNVGEVYTALARDVREGTRTTADLAHAARTSRLVAAMREAARSGARQHLPA